MSKKKIRIFDDPKSVANEHYPWAKEMINAMWDGMWTPNEFSFSADAQSFKVDITDEERGILTKTISMIVNVEHCVKSYWLNIGKTLPHPEIHNLGGVMGGIEIVHFYAYRKIMEVLNIRGVIDEHLKNPIVNDRVKYLKKYLEKNFENDKKQFLYSLILFTIIIENISLFSQFYIVLWMGRNKNAFKDLVNQIDYTQREEKLHHLAGEKIINTIREEYPELFDEELEARIQEAFLFGYEIESKIIDWIIGNYSKEGMTKEELKEFIKERFNESAEGIKYKKPFVVNQELLKRTRWFDEKMLGNNMKDFFHGRPTEYTRGKEVNEDELF